MQVKDVDGGADDCSFACFGPLGDLARRKRFRHHCSETSASV
jgi:hypothetical protein